MKDSRLPLFALLAANAVSRIGNVVAAIAIPWFVLLTSGSAVQTGVAAFFATAPLAVGAFFGGAIVDRVGARLTSVAGDIMSGVSLAGIPLLHAAGVLEFWQLAALASLSALFDAPAAAAREALVPDLALRAGMRLERANSLLTGTEHIAYLLGAPAAGLLIAVLSAPAVLWLDVASFGAAALTVLVAVPDGVHRARRATYARDLVEGLAFLRQESLLGPLLLLSSAGNLLYAGLGPVLLPIYAQEVFGTSTSLGLMVAAYGLGGLAGAAAFAFVDHHVSRRALYLGGWIGSQLFVLLLVGLPALVVVLLALFVVGLAAGAIGPIDQTLRQERTPPPLRGRVFSLVIAAQAVVAPIGMLLAGVAADRLGVQLAFVVFAITNAALVLLALAIPAFRLLNERASAHRPSA
jgi:MFS family permease